MYTFKCYKRPRIGQEFLYLLNLNIFAIFVAELEKIKNVIYETPFRNASIKKLSYSIIEFNFLVDFKKIQFTLLINIEMFIYKYTPILLVQCVILPKKG